jgi:hypothetical protein
MKPLNHQCSDEECGHDGETCPCRQPIASVRNDRTREDQGILMIEDLPTAGVVEQVSDGFPEHEQRGCGMGPADLDAGLDDTETRRSWWWSRDEERYFGPCGSRADAIMEAWADDPDQGAHICRAACGKWRTDIIDPDVLAEAFDDANEEQCDPEGDPASAMGVDWAKLAKELNRVIYVAIRAQGSAAWAFEHQTNGEWVNIPAMWALADAPEEASPRQVAGESSRAETPNQTDGAT